ncbi:TonB-dependent receptor plug domain-containing protein [Acinetobacter indicus]|uniref:TonB-dependent receptor plug domain-containing protein n=1 Tax=Acinetobacter indicus TaxID=756892 RepID=UPI000CEC9BDF|nr:TonB-dependent receptor [Acinetobacter indicus]MDM1292256.1 TonB-dependent receptor [Acinetobacter indicus]MDM1322286.1 TonB-dependent receptor [Acinetobacter indicus]MDM1334022.1 TonB-dependent receptor [Acinetobacter indicus]QIZ59567.1 TonB-dependent receptor [Acinetobacter indicus]
MSIQFQPTALVGAIALAMGFSTSVFAKESQEQPAVNAALDTLVVTATRSEEKIGNVPARISVIDQKTIESNPILNVSELIQRDPSVYIKQSGGFGQISEIRLRGTNAAHTLVLKDGARLNSQNHYGPLYPTFLDTTDVQQVEILKGPASVQYGTDAIGGVVQLLSKKPEKSGAEITGIYGENQTYKTITKANLVTDNGFYAQVSGQRLETDGTRILDNQNKNQKASFDQKGYGAKVGYENDGLKASISISQNEGVNQFYNWMTGQNDALRFFENRLINSNIAYDIADNLTLAVRFSNFIDHQYVQDSEPGPFDTENKEGDVNLRWAFTPQQSILLGSTYLKSDFQSNSIKDKKQDIDSLGYYLQHQYSSEKLNTQVGIRAEDNELFGTHTVGQGAIRYQILPATSIYANVGSAFKAPSLTELYYFSEGFYPTYGNPDLKPEKSVSYEIGVDQIITDQLTAYLSAYQTHIKNLIVSDYLGQNKSSFANVEKSEVNGGEIGFKWRNQDLFLSTEYAYADSKNKKTNNNLAYRPKQTFTLSTGLENAAYGISASFIARSDIYTDTANKVKAPGYATVDLNMYWNLNPNMKLFSNIQNIGDVNYKIADNFGDGWYVNEGRLASVGVTVKY